MSEQKQNSTLFPKNKRAAERMAADLHKAAEKGLIRVDFNALKINVITKEIVGAKNVKRMKRLLDWLQQFKKRGWLVDDVILKREYDRFMQKSDRKKEEWKEEI